MAPRARQQISSEAREAAAKLGSKRPASKINLQQRDESAICSDAPGRR